jgi:hypothetical protein
MPAPKSYYRSFADFQREELRPSFKVGFSMQDLVEEATLEQELNFDPDRDPFEIPEDLP